MNEIDAELPQTSDTDTPKSEAPPTKVDNLLERLRRRNEKIRSGVPQVRSRSPLLRAKHFKPKES